MNCFIIASDRHEGGRLLGAVAQRLGYPTSQLPSLAALAADRHFREASRPLVLVASEADGVAGPRAAIDFAQEHREHAFVVCVAEAIAPDDYKQLVRTGAAEWIQWGSAEQELRDLTARLVGPDAGTHGAKVVSFLPSKGGVGNTMLAVEAAVHLAARRKRGGGRVALLDLNLQGGTVADALDVEPRFDVAEIIGRPERLDEQLIDVFTSRHSPRLDVFASPVRQIGPDEVGPQIIFTFIDSISSRYDFVLFDLPQHWLPWTDDLLHGSDAVVATGIGSVPALRRLGTKLNHLDAIGVPATKLAVVLNQVEVDFLGRVVRRNEIERVLAGRRTFFVRRDHAAVGEALDVGRPLMEMVPNHRIARDIRRMVDWVEGAAGQAAGARARQGTAA